jgi:hypothetical protein
MPPSTTNEARNNPALPPDWFAERAKVTVVLRAADSANAENCRLPEAQQRAKQRGTMKSQLRAKVQKSNKHPETANPIAKSTVMIFFLPTGYGRAI